MAWAVNDIRFKIKSLVGDSGLEDDDLLVRINRIYRNALPMEFALESLKTTFFQVCVVGIEEYPVDPNTYLQLSEPGSITNLTTGEKSLIRLRKDRSSFFAEYPLGGVTGTPHEVLFSHNNLYPKPTPDGDYAISLATYKKPTKLVLGTDTLVEDLWAPIIACDVAIEILLEEKDTDGAQPVTEERAFWVKTITKKEIFALEGVRARSNF